MQLNETVDVTSVAIYYAENIAGGANTVTVSDTLAGGTLRFAIFEYAGVATANSLDGVSSAQGTSATPNSGPATTTSNGNLVLGVLSTANPRTLTAGSGYVVRERVPAAPDSKLNVEDQRQVSAGPVSAGGTLNSSDVWGAVVAAFRAASGGSAPDLTLSKTHVGTFTRGTWATYTLTATNRGTASTSGQVIVTDALPTGLSATAVVGTGWNCTLATLTLHAERRTGAGGQLSRNYPDSECGNQRAGQRDQHRLSIRWW